MSSLLSKKKKFWAKDLGSKGYEIYDLTQNYHTLVKPLPRETERVKVLELLEELDKGVK